MRNCVIQISPMRRKSRTIANAPPSNPAASNSAVNVVTGANIVTEGSFSNASGLPMVIQNSGANVLIQNATIINVQFK